MLVLKFEGNCNMYEFMEVQTAVKEVMGNTKVVFDGWQLWYYAYNRRREEARATIKVTVGDRNMNVWDVLDEHSFIYQGLGS